MENVFSAHTRYMLSHYDSLFSAHREAGGGCTGLGEVRQAAGGAEVVSARIQVPETWVVPRKACCLLPCDF